MMRFQVIIAANLLEDGMAILRNAPDLELIPIPQTLEALTPHLTTMDALILGDQLHLDQATLAQATQLQIIGRVGSQLDNLDVEAATRQGIIVMNTPGVDAVTVAEYTFTLMLALVRNVFAAHQNLQQGAFDPTRYMGRQLKGKTLGIVGYGRVGQEIASRAIAFGLEVLVTDPYIPESQVAGLRLKLVGTDELISRADIISLHSTVLPETQHFLNAERLARMKHGVYLINVKHHSLIDPVALAEALDREQVQGAAVDDFDLRQANPLIGHPRVIHSQRMRSNTLEAQRDLSTLLATQLIDALHKQNYRNAINLPFMPGREYDVIQPQMKLAEKIGILQYHLGKRAPIERVEISIQGDEMSGLIKPFTVGILKGLLTPMLGTAVNYINAPVIAHERGITVTQSNHLGMDSYPNLLVCRVLWSDGFELIIAGAIFNQTEPRIVQVDQYRTDFIPQNTLLIMGSYDVPGVIGQVGTYMANQNINIAGWRTSRVDKGGNTLSIIGIDEPLSEELLADLRSKEFVRHATQISFED